jgi:DNA-binding winged helix-turn-helix (wHTH) protein/tetratricopeptide (TPR) repeat protein
MTKRAEFFYEFGPFRIDPAQRLLLREGRVVALTPKLFDTLLVLIENCGQVLEKDELMEKLWPDSFVEEGSLTQNVSLLRKLLGERHGEESYIETLPRRGYRFVADVRQVANERFDLILRRRTRARIITREEEETDEALGEATAHASRLSATTAQVRTLAVLPFHHLGSETGDEYLGLGLADVLITQLSNTRQIVVRPTSAVRKYADSERDSVSIGRELGVDAVLEGSIQRAGSRIRATVQMLGVEDEIPLWADRFDAEMTDIFCVQDAISEQVAHALTLKLSSEERKRLTKRYTTNAEAYQAYLKGRYCWNKRDLAGIKKSIEYFRLAITKDSDYALAYVGLADAYNLLHIWSELPPKENFGRAKAAATAALKLDDELAEAYASLGYAILPHDWDWAGAEKAFRRSIELNPNYATAHQWYGKLLMSLGRFEEALAELKLAQQLDPLSPGVNNAAGGVYYYSRQWDKAIEQFSKVLDLNPNFLPALYSLGICLREKGRHAEALAQFQKAVEFSDRHPVMICALATAYARAGERERALELLRQLKDPKAQRHVSFYDWALLYTALGETDKAFECLEEAYLDHNANLSDLNIDPEFDPLRNDPRFGDLLRRVGLVAPATGTEH